MPATYTLISSNVLTTTTASVTFSAIPATYTDLVLRISGRGNRANTTDEWRMTINGLSTTIYSDTIMYGSGTSATSSRLSNGTIVRDGAINAATSTSNTFSSLELYIPSYTVSQSKPFSYFGVTEINAATTNSIDAAAYLWRDNGAISTLVLTNASGSWVADSSFYLYGISNA